MKIEIERFVHALEKINTTFNFDVVPKAQINALHKKSEAFKNTLQEFEDVLTAAEQSKESACESLAHFNMSLVDIMQDVEDLHTFLCFFISHYQKQIANHTMCDHE